MWSEVYRDYVKDLVTSNRAEYPYYLAVTNTNISTGYGNEYPAFKVYFSKEPITATGLYSYKLPADSICYTVIGGNASSNYHSQRVTTSTAGGNLNINTYEFVYTNAEFTGNTIQPDIMATNNVKESTFQGVAWLLFVLLIANIVVRLVKP